MAKLDVIQFSQMLGKTKFNASATLARALRIVITLGRSQDLWQGGVNRSEATDGAFFCASEAARNATDRATAGFGELGWRSPRKYFRIIC